MTGKTCFDFLIWRVFCSQASLYGNHGHIWGKIGVCCSFEKKARDSSLAGTTTGLYGLLKMLTWQSGGWWFSVLCCTSRVLGYSFLFVCPELSYLCLLLFPITRWACDVNWVWSEVVNDNLIHKYQVHFSRLVADFFCCYVVLTRPINQIETAAYGCILAFSLTPPFNVVGIS